MSNLSPLAQRALAACVAAAHRQPAFAWRRPSGWLGVGMASTARRAIETLARPHHLALFAFGAVCHIKASPYRRRSVANVICAYGRMTASDVRNRNGEIERNLVSMASRGGGDLNAFSWHHQRHSSAGRQWLSAIISASAAPRSFIAILMRP